MSKWLNNKKRIYKNNEIDMPCDKLDYCPYGALVEEFPLHPEFKDESDLNKVDLNTGYSCTTFGHDCPVFYLAEFVKTKNK